MHKLTTYITLFILLITTACKPSLPEDILSEGTMEDVLYDLHIAHFIPKDAKDLHGREAMEDGALQYSRQIEVLKKYDITPKEWDKSLNYYIRHAELLASIYNNVYDRMAEDALAMGISVGEGIAADSDIEGLDSTDVWNEARHLCLVNEHPNNNYQWQMEVADTVFKKGERVTLSFKSVFANSEAIKRGTVVLAIHLDNDSIMQTSAQISSSGIRTVTIKCPDNFSIKKIAGVFILQKYIVPHSNIANDPAGNKEQLSQALMISDIKLLHEAPKEKIEQEKKETTPTDSLSATAASDTVKFTQQKDSKQTALPASLTDKNITPPKPTTLPKRIVRGVGN